MTEFIDDVDDAYAWADVIVCRSGALTVSEVSAAGLAAIFIPYPHKDRQQALNADYLVDAGAAKMIEQNVLSVDALHEMLADLGREELLQMAIESRKAAKVSADKVVAEAIQALTK
ncbi:UDP-N-acetylglucosamine-N-acetylmuramyl-pentapeptide pyrophosphoryl-undecaprenol N-acetylglucosamine transferase [Vibrio ishigakensis]|uniref:UDP-N-acetylglucosamine-N-acetylmuramyl-pentapeptide pyrophosphoryl-undecaprenol N-acetylglucosamine transferase n=1 Tax=Vibrio ishigakensis TaxID=1481914 RepID=A0A0B8NTU6_9VIBR|nr:UDP-N-acetylglucosamine-N-acetylmuramyl-pentapeptide pyrophosphoryl-undecaprenol N-acetylglucosamine transferase [Vibrio ishigakensis]